MDSLKGELKNLYGSKKGEILNLISKEFLLEGQLDSAKNYIDKSRDYNYSNEYYSNYLKSLEYKCNLHNLLGEFDEVITTANKGIRLANLMSSDKKMAVFYNFLPYAYSIKGDYTIQMESTQLGLKYAEKAKDTMQIIIAHGYLASFYWHIDDLDQATRETQIALKLAENFPKFKKTSTLHNNLATFYYSNEKYDQALHSSNTGLGLAKNTADSSLLQQNIGIIFYLKDSFKLATKHLNKAYNYFEHSNNKLKIGLHYFYTGMIALKEKKYLPASTMLDTALFFSKKTSSIEIVSAIYQAKSEIAEHYNQPAIALTYLKKHQLLNDSIFKQNNIIKLKENEWKSELQIKEKEKEFLLSEDIILRKKVNAERQAKILSFVASGVSFLIVISLIILIIQRNKIVQTRRRMKALEYQKSLELKDKELLTLKMQRVNRGNIIEELNTKLNDLKSNLDDQNIDSDQIVKDFSMISRNLESNIEKDWEEFKLYFENIHESFFKGLRSKYPKITTNDEKIVAYIKVNIDTKQIARLLNVSPETVHTQRYRLRKKMDLPKSANIRDYLEF